MRNNGYKVPTLFALLGSVYFVYCDQSPDIMLNGTLRIVFPGDQLDRFYDCLCINTSTSCTVLYSKNFSVLNTSQSGKTKLFGITGQQNISYNCSLHPDDVRTKTNFSCIRNGATFDSPRQGDDVSMETPMLLQACGNDRFVTILWASTVNVTVSNWGTDDSRINEDGSNGTLPMTQPTVKTAMSSSGSSNNNSTVTTRDLSLTTASTRTNGNSNRDSTTTTKENGVTDPTTTTRDPDTSTSGTTPLPSSTDDNSASTSHIFPTSSATKHNTITGNSVSTTKNEELTFTTAIDLSRVSYNMTQNTAASGSRSTTSPHIIAGTVSGCVLLIAIIIIVVVIWRRRKAKAAKELKANRPNISIPFQHSKEPALTTQSSPIPVSRKDLIKSCDLKSHSLNMIPDSHSHQKASSNDYEYCFGEDEYAIVPGNNLVVAYLATSSSQSKNKNGINQDKNKSDIYYSTIYSTTSDITYVPQSKEQTTPTLTASVSEEIECAVVDKSKKSSPDKKPRFNIANKFKQPNTSDFTEAADSMDGSGTSEPEGSEYTEVEKPKSTPQNIYSRLGEQVRDMKNPYNFL